jgi:hypothetical protein
MFQDLDSTLSKILDDPAMNAPPLAPPLAELLGAEVSFITPDKNFETALVNSTVNLFLYDVKENRELRDPTPIVEKVGNTFVRRQAPVRVDCSYIVTAWSKLTNQQKVAEEHRLLAQALLWLTRFPVIPPVYLQGRLTSQIYPPQMWVAQIDPNKNAGEFWDALAIPPRPAFYVTVTIAMDLGLADSGPLVTTRLTGVTPGDQATAETMIQIGGQVLGPPVAALRAQTNLVNAAIDKATLPNPAQAAQFKRGDIVLLTQAAKNDRASVANVTGATLTFETKLTNSYTGGNIRIDDLQIGQSTLRVTDTAHLNQGTTVSISQAGTSEEATVKEVDQTTNLVTLITGLNNLFTMKAPDAPVNLTPGIADAVVDILDPALRIRSGSDGRYTFIRVPAGTHTIRAVAIGFQPKTQPLVVPSLPENYDINLVSL